MYKHFFTQEQSDRGIDTQIRTHLNHPSGQAETRPRPGSQSDAPTASIQVADTLSERPSFSYETLNLTTSPSQRINHSHLISAHSVLSILHQVRRVSMTKLVVTIEISIMGSKKSFRRSTIRKMQHVYLKEIPAVPSVAYREKQQRYTG